MYCSWIEIVLKRAAILEQSGVDDCGMLYYTSSESVKRTNVVPTFADDWLFVDLEPRAARWGDIALQADLRGVILPL